MRVMTKTSNLKNRKQRCIPSLRCHLLALAPVASATPLMRMVVASARALTQQCPERPCALGCLTVKVLHQPGPKHLPLKALATLVREISPCGLECLWELRGPLKSFLTKPPQQATRGTLLRDCQKASS